MAGRNLPAGVSLSNACMNRTSGHRMQKNTLASGNPFLYTPNHLLNLWPDCDANRNPRTEIGTIGLARRRVRFHADSQSQQSIDPIGSENCHIVVGLARTLKVNQANVFHPARQFKQVLPRAAAAGLPDRLSLFRRS
jgi:hypothetical protein